MNIESSQDILDLSGSSNEESIGPSPLISSISQSKLKSPVIARNPSESSSSITPSPVIVIMSLSTALQRNTTESCQCHHNVDSLLSKFDQLNISDRNEFFGRLIIKLTIGQHLNRAFRLRLTLVNFELPFACTESALVWLSLHLSHSACFP